MQRRGIPANLAAIGRLTKRFRLTFPRDMRDAQLHVIPDIMPVTGLDELLRTLEIWIGDQASVVGTQTVLTVPKGERRHLFALIANRSAGDRTATGWYLIDPAGNTFQLVSFAASPSYTSGLLAQVIPLDELWSIAFEIGAGSSDGLWYFRAIVQVEDAFNP